MKSYITYTDVTKAILDTVAVGDLIKMNDWKKPMKVKGVSDNYFVMTQNLFGDTHYSVCEKKILQPEGYIHNGMIGGKFHCSSDNMTFGYIPDDWQDGDFRNKKQYDFENFKWIAGYLQAFQDEKIKLSHRHGMAINSISIKKGK